MCVEIDAEEAMSRKLFLKKQDLSLVNGSLCATRFPTILDVTEQPRLVVVI